MAGKSASENKTVPTAVDPNIYVATIENAVRRQDAETLLSFFERLTGHRPKMWGPTMIGFGEYHYVYDSGREGDMFLAGFAPRKTETVVYLMGSFPEQAALLEKLGKHRMGKACLYIKKLADVDMQVLEELTIRSVRALEARHNGG